MDGALAAPFSLQSEVADFLGYRYRRLKAPHDALHLCRVEADAAERDGDPLSREQIVGCTLDWSVHVGVDTGVELDKVRAGLDPRAEPTRSLPLCEQDN